MSMAPGLVISTALSVFVQDTEPLDGSIRQLRVTETLTWLIWSAE